ncbi:MAG: hypothetical protein K0R61_3979 [Microvirga sp.]|jgi:hypothetical protein|nr:hypothetical protein [Microvirga sp.]
MTRLRRVALIAGLTLGLIGGGLVTTLGTGADRHLVRYYWWNIASHQPGERPGLTQGYTLASTDRTPL